MPFFRKTMSVTILCKNITSKYCSDNLRKLEISFWTYLGQTKIWKFTCLFYLSNWINQSSFEVLSLENVLINRKLFQKCKIAFTLKTTVYKHIVFIWMKLAMKQLLQKLYSEFLHLLNFSCTWNRTKEISSCR